MRGFNFLTVQRPIANRFTFLTTTAATTAPRGRVTYTKMATPPPQLPPGFTITRCDPSVDIPRMVDIYLEAFAGGDYAYWWTPDLEAMRAWNAGRMARWFHDPSEAVFKVVDETETETETAAETTGKGKLVAFARWVLPPSMRGVGLREPPLPLPEVEGSGGGDGSGNTHPDLPLGADVDLYREFFEGVKRAGEKWGAGTERLELSLLVADAARQGRGLGTALVRHGFRAADAEGVDVLLDAVGRAAPLYERLGFETVDRVDFPLAAAEGRAARETCLRVMVREPVGTVGGGKAGRKVR